MKPLGKDIVYVVAGLVLVALVTAVGLVLTPLGARGAQAPGKQHMDLREIGLNEVSPLFSRAIFTYGPWDKDAVEVRNLRLYPARIRVPKGANITFLPRPPANGRYIGRVTIPVTVFADGEPIHRVQISGEVEVYREVVCVKVAKKKGDILRVEDLSVTRRPMSRLHGEPFTDVDEVVGMELRRGLRSGQVVRARDLRRPILVRRGQLVTVVARSSHLTITLPGRAEDSGAMGDVIRVKNPATKKVILAEVKGKKTVEVVY